MADAATKKVSLYSLAQDAYRAANGKISEARTALEDMLAKDKKLRASLIDDALSAAIAAGLNEQASLHRKRIIDAAATPPAMGRASVISLATGLAAGYLDWPLANGKQLRFATRADLILSIERYSGQAASLQTRAKWLELVLQSLPDEAATVGARLSEERIAELFKEVSRHG